VTELPRRPSSQVHRRERRTRVGRVALGLAVLAVALVPAVAYPATGPKESGASAKKAAAKPPALPKRCTELGIYRDNPVAAFPSLTKGFGPRITTVSTYVTAGTALDPKLAALARARGLRLLVTWMPDAGADDPDLPRFSLQYITGGSLDADLRALARELKAARVPVLFRPMPEPNTPWYSWSGLRNGNTPSEYALAWKHVRKVVRQIAGPRVSFLWSPYARSIPDIPANSIERYFPGSRFVDVVGASGYNFGAVRGLEWLDAKSLFMPAYTAIQKLARKPFWITETGSTAAGGSKTGWIASLRALRTAMPKLRGLVWFDVNDPEGDFRLVGPALKTARSLLKGRCVV
jgi:hypothetical protein